MSCINWGPVMLLSSVVVGCNPTFVNDAIHTASVVHIAITKHYAAGCVHAPAVDLFSNYP